MSAPSSRRLTLKDCKVAKRGSRRGMTRGVGMTHVVIEHEGASKVVTLDITALNEDFLKGLTMLDEIELEIAIRKVGTKKKAQV